MKKRQADFVQATFDALHRIEERVHTRKCHLYTRSVEIGNRWAKDRV